MDNCFSIKKAFIYSILFLYGLTPLIWFESDRMIAGGEMCFYLNLDYTAQKNGLFSWSDKTSQVINESGQFLFYAPWLFLRTLGFPNELVQRILWVLTFMPIPFSMFYLFRSLNIARKNIMFGALIASTLYTFNLFHTITSQGYTLRFVYIFSPLILAFYIKCLKSESLKEKFRYSICVSILSIGLSVTAANPPTIMPLILACFLFSVFYINKDNILLNMYCLLLIFSLCILINQFHLIQTYMMFSGVLSVVGNQDWTTLWNSLYEGKLYESFRLLGSWSFKNHIYNPWHIYYYSSFFNLTLLSYIIPLIAFVFLLARRKNKDVLIFSIMALIALFIMKGNNPPLGFIYKSFYGTFAWMYSFRSPWAKFGPVLTLSYSIIAGYSSLKIFNYFYYQNKRYLSYFSIVLILTTILIVSFPLILGKPNDQMVYKTKHSKEPLYWKELASWFEENDTMGRVASFPNTNYSTIYNWEHGITASIPLIYNLIPNPIIHWAEEPFTTTPFQVVSNLPYNFFGKDRKSFIKCLYLSKTKYILQQNDVNYNHPHMISHGVWNKRRVYNLLKNDENITYIKTFGELDLFKVEKRNNIIEASDSVLY